MTVVASEKFVSETNVTAQAAYDLMIHHSNFLSIEKNSELKQITQREGESECIYIYIIINLYESV